MDGGRVSGYFALTLGRGRCHSRTAVSAKKRSDWGRTLESTSLVRPFIPREYLEEFVKKCKSVLIRIAARYLHGWAAERLNWKGGFR